MKSLTEPFGTGPLPPGSWRICGDFLNSQLTGWDYSRLSEVGTLSFVYGIIVGAVIVILLCLVATYLIEREEMKKCFCSKSEPIFCGDCDAKQYPLSDQEADDVLNAISFFLVNYGDKGALQTFKAMRKLKQKLWKIKRYSK